MVAAEGNWHRASRSDLFELREVIVFPTRSPKIRRSRRSSTSARPTSTRATWTTSRRRPHRDRSGERVPARRARARPRPGRRPQAGSGSERLPELSSGRRSLAPRRAGSRRRARHAAPAAGSGSSSCRTPPVTRNDVAHLRRPRSSTRDPQTSGSRQPSPHRPPGQSAARVTTEKLGLLSTLMRSGLPQPGLGRGRPPLHRPKAARPNTALAPPYRPTDSKAAHPGSNRCSDRRPQPRGEHEQQHRPRSTPPRCFPP